MNRKIVFNSRLEKEYGPIWCYNKIVPSFPRYIADKLRYIATTRIGGVLVNLNLP